MKVKAEDVQGPGTYVDVFVKGTLVGRVFEGEANDACLTATGALTVDMTLWNETVAEHHGVIPVCVEGTYSE